MTQAPEKRRPIWPLILTGAAAFVCTALAAAPAIIVVAPIAAASKNVSYSDVSGTIWQGNIENLSVSGSPIGNVDFRISPFSVLRLSPKVDVRSAGAVQGTGSASVSIGGRLEVNNADFTFNLARLAQRGILGNPVEGTASVVVDRIALKRSGCAVAAAQLSTDVLDAPAKRFQGTPFPLSGEIRCDGDDLLVAMTGDSAEGTVAMYLRIRSNLTYELTAMARPRADAIASTLLFFGFEDQNGTLVYGSAGVLGKAQS